MAAGPSPAQRRRLREMWRSAGWPCHDALELELLAAGWLQRHWDAESRETLRVTDAGLAVLAESRLRHQAARGAHEALVSNVAQLMLRGGRIAWRGLALRAPLVEADGHTRWVVAMPDVFSIRHTTAEDLVEPIVHEIKVSRADLRADLRQVDKAQAYLALASQCWYVLREGIAAAEEIPEPFGVMVERADGGGLEVLRPAPRRPCRPGLLMWMALARANAEVAAEDSGQPWLAAGTAEHPQE